MPKKLCQREGKLFDSDKMKFYKCEICKAQVCEDCIPKRLKKRKVCIVCYNEEKGLTK